MSEDQIKQEHKDEDNKLVSDKEIADVEAEIKAKQAEEMKKMSEDAAKAIEDKVRKEYADKAEKEKLQKELEDLKNADKSAKEELEAKLKAQEEAFTKKLEELQGQKKRVAKNESHFNDKDAKNPDIKTLPSGDKVDVSKLDMKEVEKESAERFAEYLGYPKDTFIRR